MNKDQSVTIDAETNALAEHILTAIVKDPQVYEYLNRRVDSRHSEESIIQNLLLMAAIIGQP